MALSPTLVDREQAKFRPGTSGTESRVAVDLEGPSLTAIQSIDTKSTRAFSGAANTRPSVTNVDATVLASNASRKYALFVNNTAATIYLKLGAAAVVNQGIQLGPNDRYEITSDNLFTGAVHAIKSTAVAVNLDVFEGS